MIKAYLLDDEPHALNFLENLLREEGVNVIGKSGNPYRALEEIETMHPDVVFLDIGMPGLNGMEVAEILNSNPIKRVIVFVTAFNEHAIRAFEVQALDYVLKPYGRDRLESTVRRIRKVLKK